LYITAFVTADVAFLLVPLHFLGCDVVTGWRAEKHFCLFFAASLHFGSLWTKCVFIVLPGIRVGLSANAARDAICAVLDASNKRGFVPAPFPLASCCCALVWALRAMPLCIQRHCGLKRSRFWLCYPFCHAASCSLTLHYRRAGSRKSTVFPRPAAFERRTVDVLVCRLQLASGLYSPDCATRSCCRVPRGGTCALHLSFLLRFAARRRALHLVSLHCGCLEAFLRERAALMPIYPAVCTFLIFWRARRRAFAFCAAFSLPGSPLTFGSAGSCTVPFYRHARCRGRRFATPCSPLCCFALFFYSAYYPRRHRTSAASRTSTCLRHRSALPCRLQDAVTCICLFLFMSPLLRCAGYGLRVAVTFPWFRRVYSNACGHRCSLRQHAQGWRSPWVRGRRFALLPLLYSRFCYRCALFLCACSLYRGQRHTAFPFFLPPGLRARIFALPVHCLLVVCCAFALYTRF